MANSDDRVQLIEEQVSELMLAMSHHGFPVFDPHRNIRIPALEPADQHREPVNQRLRVIADLLEDALAEESLRRGNVDPPTLSTELIDTVAYLGIQGATLALLGYGDLTRAQPLLTSAYDLSSQRVGPASHLMSAEAKYLLGIIALNQVKPRQALDFFHEASLHLKICVDKLDGSQIYPLFLHPRLDQLAVAIPQNWARYEREMAEDPLELDRRELLYQANTHIDQAISHCDSSNHQTLGELWLEKARILNVFSKNLYPVGPTDEDRVFENYLQIIAAARRAYREFAQAEDHGVDVDIEVCWAEALFIEAQAESRYASPDRKGLAYSERADNLVQTARYFLRDVRTGSTMELKTALDDFADRLLGSSRQIG